MVAVLYEYLSSYGSVLLCVCVCVKQVVALYSCFNIIVVVASLCSVCVF